MHAHNEQHRYLIIAYASTSCDAIALPLRKLFGKSVHAFLFLLQYTLTYTHSSTHTHTHTHTRASCYMETHIHTHRLSIFYFEMHSHTSFFIFPLVFSRYFCPWRLLHPVQQVYRGSLPKIQLVCHMPANRSLISL